MRRHRRLGFRSAAEPDETSSRRQHPPDLRLVVPAAVAWAAMLVGIVAGAAAAAALTVLAGVASAVAVRHPRCPSWVRAAAGCAAAAGVVISVQAVTLAQHPLRVAAERGAAATVTLQIRDDPRVIRSDAQGSWSGEAGRVLVSGWMRHAEVGDGRWATGGRILLMAPSEGWGRLLPGQVVTADGLLAPTSRRDLTVALLRVRGPPRNTTDPPWWQAAAGGLRTGLREAAQVLPPGPAGLLPGLAVGDTSMLTAEVEADFRAAGLTHLLAVSGANLAILSGAVLGLMRLLRADPRLAAGLALAAMVGFVVLARPSPSVVRAAAMGAIVLFALASGRGRSAVPALAAAVLVLLLIDPALAIDPGFALSVSATAALVLLAPGWTDRLRGHRVPGWVAEALTVPTAAFVVTAPLVAGLSGQISLVTVLANLLAVPAVAPVTVLGVAAAVLSPLGQPVAQVAAWAAGPAVWWLVLVGDRSAAVPGAVLPWPDGVTGGLLLAAGVLALLLFGRSPRFRAVLAAVLVGLALVLVPTRVVEPGWPPTGWSLVACDVGQGDALVLATRHPGWAVLVDTGPDDDAVDGCLDRLGVRGLALIVLSHLHADHIGGLAGAIRGRAVAGIAVGPVTEPRWALRAVAEQAGSARAPVLSLRAGQRLRWSGLAVDVIGPTHPATWLDPDDGTAVNDSSLVLRADTPAGRVLLTGDIELAAQSDLLGAGVDLRADVLKLPHHGSRYTAPAFLAAVRPRAVLVSVGAGNRYRHPDPGLLGRLEATGAVVRRTDQAGDIAVATDSPGPGDPDVPDRPSDPGNTPAPAIPPGPNDPPDLDDPPGHGLTLVSRGDPTPARRRRSVPVRPGLSARGPPGPRTRPCCWPARSPTGRSARTPRRGSSARPR
jgi:competence protein ComEC